MTYNTSMKIHTYVLHTYLFSYSNNCFIERPRAQSVFVQMTRGGDKNKTQIQNRTTYGGLLLKPTR